jgi:hypothetical protein
MWKNKSYCYIVQNVFSPSSIEMVLNDLHDCPFPVATDASNKGNIKCWPLLLSYFSRTEGCKKGLIDFYGDGRSDDITEQIGNKLAENELAFENMVTYSASVNYGVHLTLCFNSCR